MLVEECQDWKQIMAVPEACSDLTPREQARADIFNVDCSVCEADCEMKIQKTEPECSGDCDFCHGQCQAMTVSDCNGGVLGKCHNPSSCAGEDCDLCPWLGLKLPAGDTQKIAPRIVKWTVRKEEPVQHRVKSAAVSAQVFEDAGPKS
jgi:hypothetical protein